MPGAEVTVDGTPVETISGSVTRRLNRPSQGTVRVPMTVATGGIGSKVMVTLDDVLALVGRCTFWEVDTDEDGGYVEYQVTDPMELWTKRPARDPDGDFSLPQFIEVNQFAPQILEAILNASVSAGGGPPTDAEGPLGVEMGTFATGGVDVTGGPTDWPMTIAEIAQLLISTGQLDVVCVPIVDATNYARIDAYNGNYGVDRTATVSLDYGIGNLNVSKVKWTRDLSTVINKLWTYLGPRVGTSGDPAGDQHWRANITGSDPGLAGFPASSPYIDVINRRNTSQADYWVRMKIDIFDAQGDEATVGRELFRWRWLAESWAAALPNELVHLTPTAGKIPYGTFGEGDLVHVSATPDAAGGFDGDQRIYEYTAAWDQDSVLAISELQTSPQNEGFGP